MLDKKLEFEKLELKLKLFSSQLDLLTPSNKTQKRKYICILTLWYLEEHA